MARIVTLAMNPAVDKSASIDRVVPEQKLRCSEPEFDPGGGGINVCRAVHKLGGRATVYYTCGRANGDFLQALLERERLDHRPMAIAGRTRESFSVFESSSGQQYRFGTPGPRMTREEADRCLELVLSADPRPGYLVASGSIPPGVPEDFYARLARRAKEIGIRTILDAHGAPLRRAVEEGVFLIKPNLREFRALAGGELAHEAEQADEARRLIADGKCEIVAVSLGAAGAMMAWEGGCERMRAPTVSIKSKVGAGDSMVAGIVKATAGGASPVEAVRYGVAAGAAAVMTPGTELCRREDARTLFNQIAREKEG